MNSLKYKNWTIPIYEKNDYNFLIDNKDLADVCMVFERLADQTLYLNNGNILIEKNHYVKIKDKIYWTKTGIIRLCILLQNDEALEVAEFIEETIY